MYKPPPFAAYSARWSAPPNIDLTSQPAVSVRAFFESAYLASSLAPRYGYPGFAEQVSPPTQFGVFNIAGLKPADISLLTGTQYMHIARLDFDRVDAHWNAVVCTWSNGMTQQTDDDRQKIGGPWRSNKVTPATISLRPPEGVADATTRPHSAGRGPSRYPVTDVFGDWRTVAATYYEGAEMATCDALTDSVLPPELRHIDAAHEYRTTPLPTLPPYPGWSIANKA
ncbi:hypothetical protein [Gordonia westfalica]|uniref:hypothetical protein n=1 Tax=Gordonia westfalica TaxID=158898 RepID=UPI00111343A8|nr:hypothetical protein [Gordonia westfalica]